MSVNSLIKSRHIALVLLSFFFLETSAANELGRDNTRLMLSQFDDTCVKFCHPFYIGMTGGGGSTTWGTLVPPKAHRIEAMDLSTPTSVREGGAIWGAFVGYEFMPTFAIETAYTHFPPAKVRFSEMSLFSFEHNNLTEFTTQTESIYLIAKFMVIIPGTSVRVFSALGPAGLHRRDFIEDRWRMSAAFNAGLNYNFTPRIMGEIAFNYTSGFGVSEINPTQDFMPFVYSAFVRLAYRFL